MRNKSALVLLTLLADSTDMSKLINEAKLALIEYDEKGVDDKVAELEAFKALSLVLTKITLINGSLDEVIKKTINHHDDDNGGSDDDDNEKQNKKENMVIVPMSKGGQA